MARWAFWMVIATAVGVLIGGYSLVLIWRTVVYAKRAAVSADAAVIEAQNATKAANDQIANTIEYSRTQLRSYLMLKEVLYSIDEGPKLDGSGERGIVFSIACRIINAGQTPAQNMKAFIHWYVWDQKEGGPVLSDLGDKEHRGSTVGPGVTVDTMKKRVTFEDVVEASWSRKRLFLFLHIRYDDIWGERHTTDVCLRTHPEFQVQQVTLENYQKFETYWSSPNWGDQNGST